jgi:hypothetical protein
MSMYQPRVRGGMHLRATWASRLEQLARAFVALFVAAVLLPVPVFVAIKLGAALAAGSTYDAGVLGASAVFVLSSIAVRAGAPALVAAFRPLEPIYDPVAEGAAVVTNPRQFY